MFVVAPLVGQFALKSALNDGFGMLMDEPILAEQVLLTLATVKQFVDEARVDEFRYSSHGISCTFATVQEERAAGASRLSPLSQNSLHAPRQRIRIMKQMNGWLRRFFFLSIIMIVARLIKIGWEV